MTRDAAIELANEWFELAKPLDGYQTHYEQLTRMLQELLANDVVAAAMLLSGNTPAIIGLVDGSLLVLMVSSGEKPPTRTSVVRRPISSDGVVLTMVDDSDAHLPSGVTAHVRWWTLEWLVGGYTLRFSSRFAPEMAPVPTAPSSSLNT